MHIVIDLQSSGTITNQQVTRIPPRSQIDCFTCLLTVKIRQAKVLKLAHSFLPKNKPKAPVNAPVITLTNAACSGLGSGKDINHSTVLYVIPIMAKISTRGIIRHALSCSGVTCQPSASSAYQHHGSRMTRTPQETVDTDTSLEEYPEQKSC